jgi:hypothetical protein
MSLMYFQPGFVIGFKQFDDSGVGEDDLIRFLFTFDAYPGSSPPCESACQKEDVFDEPDLEWQEPDFVYLDGVPGMSGYYADWFYPNVYEDEDGPDALLDIFGYVYDGESYLHSLPLAGLPPLPMNKGKATGKFFVTDAGLMDDADYWYEIHYEQRRRE